MTQASVRVALNAMASASQILGTHEGFNNKGNLVPQTPLSNKDPIHEIDFVLLSEIGITKINQNPTKQREIIFRFLRDVQALL